jgi:hypothetical protein
MGKRFEDLSLDNQKVLVLWNAGKTGLQISEIMKTTRSSIMGKIHRAKQYGIRVNGKPIRVDVVEPPPRKVKNRRLIRQAKATGQPLPEVPVPTVQATSEQIKRSVGIMRLTPMSCRFILNDEPARAIFCGAPKEKGSYCGEHAALCYHKPVIRVRKKGFKWKTSSFVLGGISRSDG